METKTVLTNLKYSCYWPQHGNKPSQIHVDIDIKDGSGTITYYWQNGVVRSYATFHCGKLNGDYYANYSDGKLRERGQYNDGDEVGTWTQKPRNPAAETLPEELIDKDARLGLSEWWCNKVQ